MATTLNLSTHRPWEDWLTMACGAFIAISPWVVGSVGDQAVAYNALAVGVAIVFLAGLQMSSLQAWEDWVQLALGLWLIISPWVFSYSQFGTLTAIHVVLGCAVAILAVLEIWQDQGRQTA